MAYSDLRTRRVAAVHSLIGISVELGGHILDGFGHLDPEHLDVLLDELRSRVRECEVRLRFWDDVELASEAADGFPF